MEIQQEEIVQEAAPALPVSEAQPKLDVADQPDPDGESVAEEVKEKIKMLGREFDSEAEAEAYVESLEKENLQVKAFNEGLIAGRVAPEARPSEPQAPVDPLADITEDEFWQNPKEALKKVYEKARKDAVVETSQTVTVENQRRQMWNDFYEANPDLRGREKYVKLVMEENWNHLQGLEVTEAMTNLAMKTREELNMAGKPQKELKSKGAATPTGASKSVTSRQEEKKPLSMSEQIATLRKQRQLVR